MRVTVELAPDEGEALALGQLRDGRDDGGEVLARDRPVGGIAVGERDEMEPRCRSPAERGGLV